MPKSKRNLNERVRDLDRFLDRQLDSAAESASRSRQTVKEYRGHLVSSAKKAATLSTRTKESLDEAGEELAQRLRDIDLYDIIIYNIINNPKKIILALIITTLIIGALGVQPLMNNINGDMEIYIPTGGPTEQVIEELRTEENTSWSVDILIIYVQSGNAFDQANITNITNVNVLNEMSEFDERLDSNRTDWGADDGVKFVLSLATVIKEMNASPPQFQAALEDLFPSSTSSERELEGNYSIPDQATVDNYVNYIPRDLLANFVNDSNADGIYDTAGIIIGYDRNQSTHQMYLRAEQNLTLTNQSWSTMSITGPVAVTDSLTSMVYDMTPPIVIIAVVLVGLVLMAFHRSIKIVFIELTSVFISVAVTMGIVGILAGWRDWPIAPQIILVAPVLVALGVAYGLYIANRFSEERSKIPDPKERMRVAVRATSRPILLSAVTTAIGFFSLVSANIWPMQLLGIALSMGILIGYAVTMLAVPSLIILLKYEKAGKMKGWSKFSPLPANNRKKILVVATIAMLLSITLIPSLESNMNLVDLAPSNNEASVKMIEYSERFGGGQIGFALIRCQEVQENVVKDTLKDVAVLDNIDQLEGSIRDVENVKALSVVDIMKVIRVPENLEPPIELPGPVSDVWNLTGLNNVAGLTFWDAIHAVSGESIFKGMSPQQILIELFYGSISQEFFGLITNPMYSKTLMYIDIPALDMSQTREAVQSINYIFEIEKGPSLTSVSPLTGVAAIMVEINDMIMVNSFQTLAIALIAVFIVLSLIYYMGGWKRPFFYAFLTLTPVLFVVSWLPLMFRSLDFDLNLLTAMIGSLIVGIGIDFGVHMTERIKEEKETIKGISKAIETSGMSFLESTCTVVAGICSVFYVRISSIYQFAVLIMLMIAVSMLAAIIILPAAYAVWIKRG